ncbi:MAG: DNA/RNA non-specific endonuclease [Treponema sp.]
MRFCLSYLKINKIKYLLLLYLFFAFFLFATDDSTIKELPEAIFDSSLTFATPIDINNVYEYQAFNLEFSPADKQARWVGYFITRERLESSKIKRKGFSFTEDKKIKEGSANDSDYKRSGYDRGHLVPARDMAFSKETLKESFLFSNISPQLPKFNRGKWAELESYVRNMAKKHEALYVITGPIFDETDEKIGMNAVSVPSYFFKALLFYTSSKVEAIGFIMPNQKLNERIEAFACSIDMLEFFVDIDVFASLPDEIEEMVEKSYSKEFWFKESEVIDVDENDE